VWEETNGNRIANILILGAFQDGMQIVSRIVLLRSMGRRIMFFPMKTQHPKHPLVRTPFTAAQMAGIGETGPWSPIRLIASLSV
jgi:hypothetical protein